MAEKETSQQAPVPQEYIVPLAGECCVSDLADKLVMEQSAVSHQLRVLRDAALVQFRRQGKTVYYSLADEHVYTLLKVGLEHVAE